MATTIITVRTLIDETVISEFEIPTPIPEFAADFSLTPILDFISTEIPSPPSAADVVAPAPSLKIQNRLSEAIPSIPTIDAFPSIGISDVIDTVTPILDFVLPDVPSPPSAADVVAPIPSLKIQNRLSEAIPSIPTIDAFPSIGISDVTDAVTPILDFVFPEIPSPPSAADVISKLPPVRLSRFLEFSIPTISISTRIS